MADAAPLGASTPPRGGALSRDSIDATLKLAVAQHQRGELALADALYGQVLMLEPANADALHLKGIVALARGAPSDALSLIENACRVVPRSPLFHRTRGEVLVALGRWSDACAALRTAVSLKPDWADAHAALGIALAACGDNDAAKHALLAATRLDPTLGEAWTNLGILHLAANDAAPAAEAFATAVAAYTRALRTGSPLIQALNGLGVAQTRLGQHAEAVENFARALAMIPAGSREAADLLANRAATLQLQARWSEALCDLRAAAALAPDRSDIWRSLSKSLVALGAIEEAEAACTRALAIDPHDGLSRYERSFIRLLAGDIANGFDDYRARPTVDRSRIPMPREPLPRDLAGRRFRLVLEQGLGEHLFFLRYAPILAARGATLAIEGDAKLLPLLRDCPDLSNVIPRDAETPEFEPLFIGDLPFLTGMAGAPPSLSLRADPVLRDKMARRLAAFGPPPYVALTWRAGIQDGKSLSKIIALDSFAAALNDVDATLVSIQRAPAPGETEALSAAIGRSIHDLSAVNDDLSLMLALLDVVDDYVGVSNTNMHLRAALGRPARVLVPHPPEFRWLARGDASPWFPGFTVYRATPDWGDALGRLAADLRRS
ncbi:MAG: tetratricopeptide repeat protein [Gemmatimonas sp.]